MIWDIINAGSCKWQLAVISLQYFLHHTRKTDALMQMDNIADHTQLHTVERITLGNAQAAQQSSDVTP